MHNYDFERHAGGFLQHTKEEHNIWSYLKFFIHLRHKKRTQYTANEDLVSKCLLIQADGEEIQEVLFDENVDETSCFPINKALSIISATSNSVSDCEITINFTMFFPGK